MRKINKFLKGLLLLGGIFSLSGCIDSSEFDPNNIAEVSWDPAYAVPVLYGSLGIDDILSAKDSAALSVYPDGLLYFKYEDKLESRNVGDLLSIPDRSLSRIYTFPSVSKSIPAGESDIVFQRNEVLDMNITPEEFTNLLLKGGMASYTVSSDIQAQMEIAFKFPTVKRLDEILEFKVQFNGTNAIQTGNGSKNLMGFDFDFSTLSPAYNKIPIEVTVTVFGGTSGETILLGDFVNYELSFSNFEYAFVAGYFGQQSVIIPPDLISVGQFGQTFDNAIIEFQEVNAQFQLVNEYGIPVRVALNKFEARKLTGEKMNIITNPASPFLVIPADLNGAGITTVDVTNGQQVFDFEPDHIYYDASVQTNPGGRAINYAADTSKLTLNLITEIPLWGSARNILLEDTVEFSLSQDINDVEVKKALLKIGIVNQFPIDAQVQLYFTDTDYNIIDSLFTGDQKKLIQSANIDANGDLITGGEGVYDEIITLENQRFENLLNADFIIIVADLATTQNSDGTYPLVKFKSDYKLDVDMGVQTEFDLTLKLN